jgi:hypothetical protein
MDLVLDVCVREPPSWSFKVRKEEEKKRCKYIHEFGNVWQKNGLILLLLTSTTTTMTTIILL